MFISFGLMDIFYTFLATQPGLAAFFSQEGGAASDLIYLLLAMPILAMMLIYFRYIMGFFMRNFERQADLYSAVVMDSPIPTISSLEKIAFYGGKIRDLPSWHHFSIKQRVDFLWRTLKEKDLFKRHNRFLIRSFVIYLVTVFGLGAVLNFTPMKAHLKFWLIEEAVQKMIRNDPRNVDLLIQRAMIYHEIDRVEEARATYETVLKLDPDRAVALNNLAWILVTDPDEASRDPERAIKLAEKAVAIEKSAGFLDTLAEAYFIAGKQEEAIETIQEAIDLAKDNRDYYLEQLKRFSSSE
jgi:tetratricopeptide (TPR) repeat protein